MNWHPYQKASVIVECEKSIPRKVIALWSHKMLKLFILGAKVGEILWYMGWYVYYCLPNIAKFESWINANRAFRNGTPVQLSRTTPTHLLEGQRSRHVMLALNHKVRQAWDYPRQAICYCHSASHKCKLEFRFFTALGLVPQKMVKVNLWLSRILSKVFLSK